MRRLLTVLLALAVPSAALAQQSAPVTDLRYDLTFTRATAQARSLTVTTRFQVSGTNPVLLSLPSWTPGAYEISNYARRVSSFGVTQGGASLMWDKTDPDTWRIRPSGRGEVTITFDFLADQLDNAMAWSRPDFLMVNGTNVFLYPEGRSLEFEAKVTVTTEPAWLVATGMTPDGAPRAYRAGNYHDLVDMPLFVGRFDFDSTQVEGKWVRLASYPTGVLAGAPRAEFWTQLSQYLPVEIAVFGVAPYDSYTNLLIFDQDFGGGSALEHQNSHVGIYTPLLIGNPVLPSITAHEIFHLWNVKRLRPADMVPYTYDRWMPTPWLWVSEGITDYYADVALVRAGVIDATEFLALTAGKMQEVADVPVVSLEDASMSAWIGMRDGTGSIYYPKGSLAGMLLDIRIRAATGNRKSLDDVMRSVYRSTYEKGRGFTGKEWWGAVSTAAGGISFDEFNARYIDGRDPFPYATDFAMAGLSPVVDSNRVARLGIQSSGDSTTVITTVTPGSAYAEAGGLVGDVLVSVGEIDVSTQGWAVQFRSKYKNEPEGTTIPVVVRRAGERLSLPMSLRFVTIVSYRLLVETNASPSAVQIRQGIMTGAVAP
ncbi:MAG: M61 family peptidase [Gemmatimonadales bacterium]|nr:MAG: M61 family peptidase [Gemmatimonadales bacterium]